MFYSVSEGDVSFTKYSLSIFILLLISLLRKTLKIFSKKVLEIFGA